MSYLIVKHVHVLTVVISGGLFLLRGGMALGGYPWRRWRVLRSLPHANDTVLLLSAIILSVMLRQYPFVHGWLTAKVLALVLYIVLGSIALRPGIRRSKRVLFFVLALVSFVYIIGVARMHHPASWVLPWL